MILDRKTIFRAFFFGAFLYLIFQLLKLLSPFFTALVAAITLALIFFPVHAAIRRRLAGWDSLAAGLSTALILLMIIVPLSFFTWILIQQAGALTPFIVDKTREWRTAPSLVTLLPPSLARLAEKIQVFTNAWQIDFRDLLLRNVDEIGKSLSSAGGRVVKNMLFLVFDFFVTAFSLFFLFRDGGRISRWIVELIPMEKEQKEGIVQRLGQTLSAVVRGVFLTAAAQGLLAGLGYAACGIRVSVFLGFLTAFLAPVPFVGAAAVWLPVSVYLVLSGAQTAGFLLMGWGALVVSLADNVLRPILIGGKAKLPVFLLFFGMLGGLQVHGPVGLLTGPLLIACALAFADIYRQQLLLSKTGDSPPDEPAVPFDE